MGSFLSPNFFIGYIRIGSVEGASCVNFGNNRPSHFRNHKKHIQGFGNVGGDRNKVEGSRSFLNDPDFIDMYNGSEPFSPPEWLKKMIKESDEKSV